VPCSLQVTLGESPRRLAAPSLPQGDSLLSLGGTLPPHGEALTTPLVPLAAMIARKCDLSANLPQGHVT
jgi:hypothetical protein